jgi:hypothetical protein
MALNIKGPGRMKGVTITENLFQFTGMPSTLIRVDRELGAGVTFKGNVYDSAAEPGRWFVVGQKGLDFEQWVKVSGEQGAQKRKIEFPDSSRGIETYMKSLGKTGTFNAFIAEVRQQSRANWRKEFTAPVINNWIREGFGVKKVSAVTPPE